MGRLDEISRNLRDYAQGSHTVILAVLLGALAIALLVYFYRRGALVWTRRREVEGLFSELAKASGLTDAEQDLLLDVADAHALPNPGVLFVSPSLVRGYAGHPDAQRRHRDAAALAARLATLAEKMFGSNATPARRGA